MRYLLLLLMTFPVFADTVSWTPPTEREDGTALPASEIAGYNIYNTQGTKINQAPIAGTSFWVDRIGTPQTLFVTTLDTENRESENSSGVVIPMLVVSPPNPPQNVEVYVQ